MSENTDVSKSGASESENIQVHKARSWLLGLENNHKHSAFGHTPNSVGELWLRNWLGNTSKPV
jgi:hypothetical protein